MLAFCKHREGPSIMNSEKCHLPSSTTQSLKKKKEIRTLEFLMMSIILKLYFPRLYLLQPRAFLMLRLNGQPNSWYKVGVSSHAHTSF